MTGVKVKDSAEVKRSSLEATDFELSRCVDWGGLAD
jgi:hypothetical protein